MPYLQVELDVLEVAPAVGNSAGIPPGKVIWGLVQMWRNAWRKKDPFTNSAQLEGFFEGDGERVAKALVGFGFLEADTFRIKGADRYLRISAARSAAGKQGGTKAQANRKQASSKPEAIAKQPSSKPEANPKQLLEGSQANAKQNEALTANSEQRAANNDLFAGAADADPPKKPAKAPTDPRHAPMVKALVSAAPGYGFTPRCAKAVSELLRLGSDAEILDRWRRALGRSDFPKVRMLSELVTHWGHFAPESTPQPQQEALTVWR